MAAIAEACALALALDTGSGGFCLAATSADAYLHLGTQRQDFEGREGEFVRYCCIAGIVSREDIAS